MVNTGLVIPCSDFVGSLHVYLCCLLAVLGQDCGCCLSMLWCSFVHCMPNGFPGSIVLVDCMPDVFFPVALCSLIVRRKGFLAASFSMCSNAARMKRVAQRQTHRIKQARLVTCVFPHVLLHVIPSGTPSVFTGLRQMLPGQDCPMKALCSAPCFALAPRPAHAFRQCPEWRSCSARWLPTVTAPHDFLTSPMAHRLNKFCHDLAHLLMTLLIVSPCPVAHLLMTC